LRKKLERQIRFRNEFRFDITQICFSRRLSYLSITEDMAPTETGADRKQLTLCRSVRPYSWNDEIKRPRRFGFRPIFDQKSISYRIEANPGSMQVQTAYGNCSICFDGPETIRLRGNGITMRFFTKMGKCEGAVDRLDGTYQVNYFMAGEYLFKPIRGKISFEAEWLWDRESSSDVVIDLEPDESGEFEVALHYAEYGAEAYEEYRPFEECAMESMEDFNKWYDMYPPVPGRYENLKKLSIYAIWVCYIDAKGMLTEPAILFSKPNASAVFSWHQAYFAMSINDPDVSAQLLMDLFAYQDEYGELCDLCDDTFYNVMATKPPFHGYALLHMINHMDITAKHAEKMYDGLANLFKWWTVTRDTDGDGIPQYNHGCESGVDASDLFAKGVPVETPDIISYCTLLAEGLSKLAALMGRTDEAAAWQAKSDRLLEVLLSDFWDGRKFISRLSTTKEIIESTELEIYMPLMLGDRLPKDIVKRMVKDLTDPELYYTPVGFRSNVKRYKDGQAMPGYIGGFAQVKLLPGLYMAGEKELARELLTGYANKSAERLPGFGVLEFTPPGAPGGGGFFQTPGGALNALAAAMFLIAINFLEEISTD